MGEHSIASASMTPEEAFGQALRGLRREHKLSQERLALESGYHRTYMSLLERGKKSPSLATIFHLAEVLAVKPSEIMGRVEAILASGTPRHRERRSDRSDQRRQPAGTAR